MGGGEQKILGVPNFLVVLRKNNISPEVTLYLAIG